LNKQILEDDGYISLAAKVELFENAGRLELLRRGEAQLDVKARATLEKRE
jgi:hypothetical protein